MFQRPAGVILSDRVIWFEFHSRFFMKKRRHGSLVMVSIANRAPLRSPLFFTLSVFLVMALQLITVEGLFCQRVEDPSPHSAADLIPEVQSMRPGEPFTVGLRITLDPGWHSYWKNPGDAGQPASIDWEIPAGFRAGEIQWPYPRIVEESTVVSYGYEDEVMLLTEISPPRFLTTGQTVRFAAKARWLVCDNICLPASADLEFEVKLTDEPPVPAARWESMFAEARSRLPTRVDGLEMSASLNDDSIVLLITSTAVTGQSFDGAHFFPSKRGVIANGAPQVVTQENGTTRIVFQNSQFPRPPLVRLTGVLVLPDLVEREAGRTRALAVDAEVTEPAENEMDTEQIWR